MVPLLALAAWWWAPSWRRGLARAAAVCVPMLVAALGFAWWQRDLYGALTETGYGGVTYLFSLAHVWPNLSTYPRWLYESHGWFLLLAVGRAVPRRNARAGIVRRLRPSPAVGGVVDRR